MASPRRPPAVELAARRPADVFPFLSSRAPAQRGHHAFHSKPQPQSWHSKRSAERQGDCAPRLGSPLARVMVRSYGTRRVMAACAPLRHGHRRRRAYENARYRRSLRAVALRRSGRHPPCVASPPGKRARFDNSNLSQLWRRRSSASLALLLASVSRPFPCSAALVRISVPDATARAQRSRESWNSKHQLFDLALATTAELVVAAQDGDNDAFGDLVSRFERMVQAVCWQRLRNHAEAQEAGQEVFIKAMKKLGQLQEPAAFAGWLRSIAVRQAINRSVRRPPALAVEPHALEASAATRRGPARAAAGRERAPAPRGPRAAATLDRSTLVAFYVRASR